jgi:hypothetical protein
LLTMFSRKPIEKDEQESIKTVKISAENRE